jgi:hypothetical protein
MAGERQVQSRDALVVTMRELSRNTARIVRRVKEEQRPAIVTGRSGIAAILQPLDTERIHRLVVESASELVATRESSEQALAKGRTMTAAALAEELGIDLVQTKVGRRVLGAAPKAAGRGATMTPKVTRASKRVPKATRRTPGKARAKRAAG